MIGSGAVSRVSKLSRSGFETAFLRTVFAPVRRSVLRAFASNEEWEALRFREAGLAKWARVEASFFFLSSKKCAWLFFLPFFFDLRTRSCASR